MQVLPLFKSHYSIARSILTLEKAKDSKENGPDSIIDIALENGLKRVVLIEDGMSGFLEAYKNCQAAELELIFGVRLTFCSDIQDKSEESLAKNHKLIIKVKNSKGYSRLIKIHSRAAKDGFYYEPRLDFKNLQEFWSEEDLQLCIPFYDSFIFKNRLTLGNCVPDFSFAKPIFFLEENELLFDSIIRKRVKEYAQANDFPTLLTKSIYYKHRKDFKAFSTFKCLRERSTLEAPKLEHFSSNNFCVESWKEQNATN